MDTVDLEKLRTFVSPEIFAFLAADGDLTQPLPVTPTPTEPEVELEVEPTTYPAPRRLGNPLEEGLDALLLACSEMYELNANEAEPSAKRAKHESDESGQPSATTSKRSFAPPKTQEEMYSCC